MGVTPSSQLNSFPTLVLLFSSCLRLVHTPQTASAMGSPQPLFCGAWVRKAPFFTQFFLPVFTSLTTLLPVTWSLITPPPRSRTVSPAPLHGTRPHVLMFARCYVGHEEPPSSTSPSLPPRQVLRLSFCVSATPGHV